MFFTIFRIPPGTRPLPVGRTVRWSSAGHSASCTVRSATLVTNPAGERTLSISDGLGRSVRTVQLDSSGDPLTQTTATYDAIVNISGYGNVVQTSSTNLLSHTTKRRTDAAGRTIEALDPGNFVTKFEYNANGNARSTATPTTSARTARSTKPAAS